MSEKRQNFPVSWYVSRIVCLAYSAPTLYWEKYPKTHAINAHQRTDRLTSREGGILFSLRWTTHPSEKGQVFLVLLGEGWGQRTGNAQ